MKGTTDMTNLDSLLHSLPDDLSKEWSQWAMTCILNDLYNEEIIDNDQLKQAAGMLDFDPLFWGAAKIVLNTVKERLT
jgi:hypothetical protein